MPGEDYQNTNAEPLLTSTKNGVTNILYGTLESKYNTLQDLPPSLKSSLSFVLNCFDPAFVLWGNEMRFFCNDAFLLLAKNTDKDLIGNPMSQAAPLLWHEVQTAVQQIKSGSGGSASLPLSGNTFTTEATQTFHISFSPVFDNEARIAGVFALIGKNEQSAIQKSDSNYVEAPVATDILRLAVEASELAVWEIDLGTDGIKYSKKLPQIFGHESDQSLTLREIREQIYPSDRTGVVVKAFETSLITGNFICDTRIVKPSGAIAYIRAFGKLFYDEKKTPVKIYGTLREITAEAENRRALEKSERRLRRLVMNAPVAIAILAGPEYIVEMMNDAALSLMGKAKEEILNKPVLEAVRELDTYAAKLLLDSVYYTGKPFSASEFAVKLKRNGVLKKVFVNFEYHPLINSQRKVYGIMVVGTDVSEQVTGRQKIEESEARFRLLADSLPLFIWSADEEGKLIYFNQAIKDYSGLSTEQIRNGEWMETVHPDERKQNIRAWRKAVANGSDFIFEHRFKRFDGSYKWYLSRAIPLKDKQGKIRLWIGSSTDIEEMKNQQDRKDFFISMASHELKTPITSIKGYVQILQSMYAGTNEEPLIKSLDRVHLQIEKLTKLIADMLDVSKIRSGNLSFQKTVFDINALVTEVAEEVAVTHSENKIVFNKQKPIRVYADRERIGQVLTNLLTNAAKYSTQKGDIIIGLEMVKRTAIVSVKDQGIGIDKSYQDKIFERFYRVEGKNEKTFPGFGIGLYIAAEIIKRHNGTIGVESAPGKGSVFYFSLPVSNRKIG